ncbi:hypothetical protein HCU74_13380 [Spongiibacter sp. KMU-166]|uniref:Uncharacterized protein n=1 Tax=Spongiibacter thalassae TaxID=2721624 RepID=A0ABX1GGW5_9GAMM|nr:hypothetical protein [Spongiibacter thalassae]NKI18403.1 hypothetical protein [Spongiibacter thalassae]
MNLIQEKRSGDSAIPPNIEALLTDMQQRSLRRIENFGWQLKFVRQPRFEPPIVVVENATGVNIGILEQDGGVNMRPLITLRD